ncbi:hypothetical protein [Bradyrhizobium sp. Ec3.3]|uniref:hypothetical protein n=1 Tax=Bradyrhizobium sp. Ec3.3 TaxID=189753 RepID=UPI0003F87437|nr:hypothetical protein [Bradyrhizobium sp. Ec3.3]
MTVAVTLLLASLVVGLATGLLFRVWALALASPLVAVVSAIVLQSAGFEFFAGVSVIVGCLVVSQLAYLLATFHLHRGKLSMEDEVDGLPGKHRQKNIRDQYE